MKNIFILLFALFLAGCLTPATQIDNTLPNDHLMEEEMIIDQEENVVEIDYDYYGDLVDVSGGQAAGVAQSGFSDGVYSLLVEFDQLPELEDGYFYEGWVVRKEPFDFISTGKTMKKGENEFNIFSSDLDFTDYDFYVLTLEPDDGDPAPAEHILEGTMIHK